MNARLIALSRRGSTKLAVIRIIDISVGLAIRYNIRTVIVQLWGIYDPQKTRILRGTVAQIWIHVTTMDAFKL